jgi:hypothetical protein
MVVGVAHVVEPGVRLNSNSSTIRKKKNLKLNLDTLRPLAQND